MAHRHRSHHRAKGGRLHHPAYTGGGSNVEHEAGDAGDRFKRGGRKHHHEHGGHVHHGKSKHRLDKRARGGRIEKSPFSSAHRPDDIKRTTSTVDHEQPRKHGGRVHHHGGHRPHAHNKHPHNYGHHHGAGHEEPLETHHPLYHKHGGATHAKRGGKMHYSGGGPHKRARGGRCEDDEEDDEDGKHIDVYKTKGGTHYWADAEKGAKAGAKSGGRKWMQKAFAHSHGQFSQKAHKAGMSTQAYASKMAASPSASTKTKRQANLAKLGAKFGKH